MNVQTNGRTKGQPLRCVDNWGRKRRGGGKRDETNENSEFESSCSPEAEDDFCRERQQTEKKRLIYSLKLDMGFKTHLGDLGETKDKQKCRQTDCGEATNSQPAARHGFFPTFF